MLRAAALLVARRGGRPTANGIVRSFADAAAQDTVPAVATHGIHGRYALALFMAGQKAKKLDVLDKDLSEVHNLASESPLFAQFLQDPSIPKTQKAAALEDILSSLKVSDIAKSFFGVLAENNRLNQLEKITETFDELLSAARGEVTATVTTAEPLGGAELAELKSGLGGLLKKGETLSVREKVDPTLIGGLIIAIGDKYIDLSISSRIKKIQQLLLENV